MWALQVLGLLADKKRARDVRLARVEYMSQRRGTSTSLVLEPPSSVPSSRLLRIFRRIAGRDRRPGIVLIMVVGSSGDSPEAKGVLPQRGDQFRGCDRVSAGKPDGLFRRSILEIDFGIGCDWHQVMTWELITGANG